MSRTVLAFGTFDRLHAGHLAFLERAKMAGDRFVVAVARDSHVRTLKQKDPAQNEQARLKTIAALTFVDEARLSDEQLGSYHILQELRPDIVVFGWDQEALEQDMRRWLEKHPLQVELQRERIREMHVVIGFVERDGRVLLLERRDARPVWDHKWEFPGGKVDRDESPDQAILRELHEETNIPILQTTFLGTHTHDWDLSDHILRVHLSCFRCLAGEGEPTLEERSAYGYAWASPREALRYDMLEANDALLKRFYASDLD